MFTNFLAALQQTALTPRRFILQTGTKHYGFYLGPAPLPAFESDPRVALGPNFYYAQEDALARFCLGPAHTKTTNTTWAVARPSYVVGAVPDGTLNHLLGIAVYAAVQARRGRRLRFPGDYRAWDREQVQSTGLLNGYFAEWLALTDMGSGEAFNIHGKGRVLRGVALLVVCVCVCALANYVCMRQMDRTSPGAGSGLALLGGSAWSGPPRRQTRTSTASSRCPARRRAGEFDRPPIQQHFGPPSPY